MKTGLGRWPKVEGTARLRPCLRPRGFYEIGTVHRALAALGVDRKTIYSPNCWNWGARKHAKPGGFWVRNEEQLQDILGEAHKAYKVSMKTAHTDKGGSHERAVIINAAWKRVKKLFGQHGIVN